jgi:hypothetical protein
VTSVDLVDTNSSAVTVAALGVAGLTNGAVLGPFDTNCTLGAGFGVALTASKGLKVVKNGSDATTGTSITVTVVYSIV